MTKPHKTPFATAKSGSLSRRDALKAAAGAAASLALPSMASAAGEKRLRWWSTQSSPEQLAAYKYQIKTFEEAHPGVKVDFERTSDEGYPAQLAAAFAGGNVPNLVTHLPSFAVADYWDAGLLLPFDGVIERIGAERYAMLNASTMDEAE